MATMMQTSRVQTASSCRRTQSVAAIELPSTSLRCPQAQIFSCAAPSKARASFAAPSRTVTRRAAPAAATDAASKSTDGKEWYALVASADFYFNDPQNESMAEQLRERVRFYKEQNREIDFFIVPEPKWLDAKYPQDAKKVQRPAVALVSTDKNWIVFMKLRLDRVLRFDMGDMPASEVLAMGGDIPEFKAPEKWTAPYTRYAPGWWKVFYPQQN